MSPNSPSESFLRWDPAQVANFVSSALPGSQQHKGTSFLEHNIEGSQLPFITTEHLKEIGIEDLGTRLRLKKAISNLCELHYQNNSPNSLTDSQYQLNNVNINSNYINIESVKLATILMKQMIRKLMTQGSGGEGLPMSPGNQQLEMKRLNDNFTKLKTDLIPVIKYLKESKPLPTPTLDPGSKSNTAESPSVMTPPLTELSNHRNLTEDPVGKQYDAMGSANPGSAKITRSNTIGASQTSPKRHSMAPSTVSNRSSTGTFMSMGSGTVIEQAIAKTVGPDGREGDSNERPTVSSSSSSRTIRPRLVEAKSTTRPGSNSFESSYSGNPAASVNLQPRSQPSTTTFGSGVGGTEPLKQLRASSDDSCLKILQHAMKRHNIHRDDWSKYVLVVCYGDKERILKVSEKPVIIFKELQEKGMHPAIMLRQLASDIGSENETLYENSRIGDDMPGGFL